MTHMTHMTHIFCRYVMFSLLIPFPKRPDSDPHGLPELCLELERRDG